MFSRPCYVGPFGLVIDHIGVGGCSRLVAFSGWMFPPMVQVTSFFFYRSEVIFWAFTVQL